MLHSIPSLTHILDVPVSYFAGVRHTRPFFQIDQQSIFVKFAQRLQDLFRVAGFYSGRKRMPITSKRPSKVIHTYEWSNLLLSDDTIPFMAKASESILSRHCPIWWTSGGLFEEGTRSGKHLDSHSVKMALRFLLLAMMTWKLPI